MARDGRQLRQEAAEATAAGKHKRALGAYLELETLEPRDAQWPKRAGETYRKLNRSTDATDAFTRAADRYAQGGFLVQAIAVCKLILQIDPKHEGSLGRLAQMNEQLGQGPTRAQGFAENNPGLHSSPNVAALRRSGSVTALPPPASKPAEPFTRTKESTAPPVMARTKSKPVQMPPGAALESVNLSEHVKDSYEHSSSPGVYVIAIDDEG